MYQVEAHHSYCLPYNDSNKWGICDTNGNVLVKPVYSKVSTFSIGKETLISFVKNNKVVVYVNAKLKPTLSNVYDSIQRAPYSAEGTYFIYLNGKIGLVENGSVSIKPMYEYLDFNNNNRIFARKNNFLGLISTKNEIIIPFEFDEIDSDWNQNQHKESNDSTYNWEASIKNERQSFTDKLQKPVDYFYDDEILLVKEGGNNNSELKNRKVELELSKRFVSPKIVSAYSSLFYVKNAEGQMGVYNNYTKNLIVPIAFDSVLMDEEIENANYCVVYKKGKVGFYNASIELLSITYDSIDISQIRRGIIFPIKNNLVGLNFLSKDIELAIKPSFRKLTYFGRFLVNKDWVFTIYHATDTNGNSFYIGENGLEYHSR
jgi:hypothetical protein